MSKKYIGTEWYIVVGKGTGGNGVLDAITGLNTDTAIYQTEEIARKAVNRSDFFKFIKKIKIRCEIESIDQALKDKTYTDLRVN